MAQVSFAVVDAVRMKNARGRAGEIMIKSLQRFMRVQTACTKQLAQEFLVFGVNAEDRVRRILIVGAEASNDLKRVVALGVPFQRQGFLRFASSQAMPLQQLSHDSNTDPKAALAEFVSNRRAGKIGPQNAFPHGIASNAGLDDVQESGVETGKQGQAGFSAAPFFRERPGGNEAG